VLAVIPVAVICSSPSFVEVVPVAAVDLGPVVPVEPVASHLIYNHMQELLNWTKIEDKTFQTKVVLTTIKFSTNTAPFYSFLHIFPKFVNLYHARNAIPSYR
jgi:hypothetical protein